MKTFAFITVLLALIFTGCKKDSEEKKADPEVSLEGTTWVAIPAKGDTIINTFTKDTIYSEQRSTAYPKINHTSILHYIFKKPNAGTYAGIADVKDGKRTTGPPPQYFEVRWYIAGDSLYSMEPGRIGNTIWGKRK